MVVQGQEWNNIKRSSELHSGIRSIGALINVPRCESYRITYPGLMRLILYPGHQAVEGYELRCFEGCNHFTRTSF